MRTKHYIYVRPILIMLDGIVILLKRKRGRFVSAPLAFVRYIISAIEKDTNLILDKLWIYFNNVKYITENACLILKAKFGTTNTLKIYAPPTESNEYFHVPEEYILTTNKIKNDLFTLKLTTFTETNEILQNATVTVEYNGYTNDYETNENGEVEITDLPRKTDIKITITKDEYEQTTIIYVN